MTFSRVLREIRKERGLTQKSLADAIGKTPAYIAALEMEVSDRNGPSLSTLGELARVLGASGNGESLDPDAVARLVFAALDIEVDLPEAVLIRSAFTKALSSAPEVWIATEMMTEAYSLECAEETAKRVLSEVRHVFILPFSTAEGHIADALDEIRAAGVGEEELEARVAIYRSTDVGHAVRWWICDPTGGRPQGFYDLSSPVQSQQDIRRMANHHVARMVTAYSALCHRHRAAVAKFAEGERVGPVVQQNLGAIELVYPSVEIFRTLIREHTSVGGMRPKQAA